MKFDLRFAEELKLRRELNHVCTLRSVNRRGVLEERRRGRIVERELRERGEVAVVGGRGEMVIASLELFTCVSACFGDCE